ncbi:hypothetical protein [Nostoc sp. MG11]|uniref:hypothetical protein n=1 Tax=Nostoc sp. MG11 TaxID=2721166 RepID=UPI0018692492|nr:hypothetical protein [Nostoc sp. MG11]
MNQPGIFDEIVLYFWSILEDFSDKQTGKNEKGVVASPKELEFLKTLWLCFDQGKLI